MKRIVTYFTLVFLVSLAIADVNGQVSLTTIDTAVTQNFDSMGTVDFNLTDNTSIIGVYALRSSGNATPNVFTVDAGTSTTGQFKNYGTALASDRALGSLGSNGTGTLFYGVRFVNNTGSIITSLDVAYTGEQWRNGNNTNPQTLSFDFQQGATVTSLTTGSYISVASLNFNTPINTTTAGSLDGNNAANRVSLSQTISVTIPIGEEVMIRWTDLNDSGNDHGVAIDDLSVTPHSSVTTAANGTISGRVMNAKGSGLRFCTVMITGGGLPEPVYAMTNMFGRYQFEDIPLGEDYILQVFSGRYTFSDPSRVVNLAQSVSDLDFIGGER